VLDTFGRPLRSLRVSLIDKCNLRCQYCMPEEEYVWLPREDILTVDEIGELVDVFSELGVDRVRLTGGEPLLRKEVTDVVERLAANPDIRDLSMTTNGVLLEKQAESLRSAGLDRVTVSLDTLRPERFKELTRRDRLPEVFEGIDAAVESGLKPLKINTVVMRGYNDDELTDMIDFARAKDAEIRFIEYMDVGGATQWSMDTVVSSKEILNRLEGHYGSIEPLGEKGSAPAGRYRLPDGTTFGIIASTTEPFCSTCDRSRLTADGMWFLCLYAAHGIDLRKPLRQGASKDEIRSLIVRGWTDRTDRGAEDRQALDSRGPLYQIKDLREDPHREMHTLGG
jgi:cyclic pyranopterin phosphate synthase